MGYSLAVSLYYSVCVNLGMDFIFLISFQQLSNTCVYLDLLYIKSLNVTGQQEVRVLTLAEQIIAAIPERIKVQIFQLLILQTQ